MNKLVTALLVGSALGWLSACASNTRPPKRAYDTLSPAQAALADSTQAADYEISTHTQPTAAPAEIELTQFLVYPTQTPTATLIPPTATLTPTQSPEPGPTSTPIPMVEGPITYGYSVQARLLQAYRIGTGPIPRAMIGGIHGGYEANTTRLVEEFFTYLSTSTDLVPPQLTLYFIPLVNPDGAAAGTDRISGRLNAHLVDLNRNWDYEWQSMATHGTQPVSAGTAPFSEPETSALRDFILSQKIQAAIFYHSAMSEVYPGAGRNTSKTVELAVLMAEYTGYRYTPECVPGQITTGDAINWLTTQGITAVEVELSTHTALDWEQNLAALLAFLAWDLEGEP